MLTPENIASPSEIKNFNIENLKAFSEKIRNFIITNISKTGGHIGANLGTVELSVALHYVFDSPVDRIIWDTGHQGYAHKILTGRAELFSSLNTYGGMSRFVSSTESEHDTIEASHAGTSISIGLGIALANKLEGKKTFAVPVIGDGALCEGLALEGLNHAAAEDDIRLVIILNDNGMAISPGFGAIHNYLKDRNVSDSKPETLFTSLGLDYIGPVDGHDVEGLIQSLQRAKDSKKVSLVHVKTSKGYGFPPAESHPFKLHFSFPFDPETGKASDEAISVGYQDVAAKTISEEMEQDEKIVAITASTLYATGLAKVFERFPDRCFDPGMEEQHAMTMTVGFALEKYKPIIFFQSTFMQRAFDQLFHDVCFANLPVLILTVRSGFAGYDNPTHHGIYDHSYLQGLPNLKILYPKDGYELQRMVKENLRDLHMPTLIQMPYGSVDYFDEKVIDESQESFSRPELVSRGKDLLLVTVGNKFASAKGAAKILSSTGISCGIVNLRYLKPFPAEALTELMTSYSRVACLEEGILEGGVGSALACLITDRNLKCELLRIGISCRFVEPGSNIELCKAYGLDSAGVAAQIKERWFSNG